MFIVPIPITNHTLMWFACRVTKLWIWTIPLRRWPSIRCVYFSGENWVAWILYSEKVEKVSDWVESEWTSGYGSKLFPECGTLSQFSGRMDGLLNPVLELQKLMWASLQESLLCCRHFVTKQVLSNGCGDVMSCGLTHSPAEQGVE